MKASKTIPTLYLLLLLAGATMVQVGGCLPALHGGGGVSS